MHHVNTHWPAQESPPTLGWPGLRGHHPAIGLQSPRWQPRPDQAQNGPGIDAHAQHLQPPVMVPVVEDALQVGLHHSAIPPVWQVKGQGTDRLPCPALGAVPITTRQNLLRRERMQ